MTTSGMGRSRRPEHRADDRQRQSVRDELHDCVDRVVDAWPVLERQAKEMGRGFPTQGDCAGPRGGAGSYVERVALEHAEDPALLAEEWLSALAEARAALVNLASKARWLLPVDPESLERGRVNEVENCALCNEPITGKTRRIDGQPYHPTSCYFRVWRSRSA